MPNKSSDSFLENGRCLSLLSQVVYPLPFWPDLGIHGCSVRRRLSQDFRVSSHRFPPSNCIFDILRLSPIGAAGILKAVLGEVLMPECKGGRGYGFSNAPGLGV
ncbi:hypothetical protein PTI98_006139 [Pleurotus ostreatus]|nr:hypothetical protein PTI98_006139 [Pleurotus ostreatus]